MPYACAMTHRCEKCSDIISDIINKLLKIIYSAMEALVSLSTVVVAPHFKCQTKCAKYLCIFDLHHKLKSNGEYDIGGTYSEGADFWFIYRSQKYMRDQYLVTLFVSNRQTGSFTLTVGSRTPVSHSNYSGDCCHDSTYIEFSETPESYDFFNVKANTYSFVKTFFFSIDELHLIEDKNLLIEIKIDVEEMGVSQHIKENVKLNHSFGKLLTEQEQTDVTLESIDGRKFGSHKAILSANSPILRKMLSESTSFLKLQDSGHNVEQLLEFLYNGSIKSSNDTELMFLGIKYEITGLMTLCQHSLLKDICVDKAIDLLSFAHTHHLNDLRNKVFEFIKSNKSVLKTKSWDNFDNVELMKELLEYIAN